MVPFLQRTAEWLRTLATQALEENQDLPFELAAHLFAVCQYLREAHQTPAMIAPALDRADVSLPAMLERLSKLAAGSPDDLYLEALQALHTLDGSIQPAIDSEQIPEFHDLEPIKADDGKPAIHGRVYHWARPRGLWARLREFRAQQAPAIDYPGLVDESLQRLSFHWSRGENPALRRFVPAGPSQLVNTSAARLVSGGVRIALCPLPGAFLPQFEIPSNTPHEFTIARAQQYLNEDALLKHLKGLLKTLRTRDAHILLLPELCITPKAVELLETAVEDHSLIGIVAGSFHVWSGTGRPHNESPLLTPAGKLWSHRKKGYFRVKPKEVRKPFFPTAPNTLPTKDVIEGIHGGSELRFIDTALGRIALVICADVLDPNGGYRDALFRAQPDLVFIVSMSPKTGDFHTFAEELHKRHSAAFFVNADCILSPSSTDDLAFAYLGIAETAGAPSTRVRWNRKRLRTYDIHEKKWRVSATVPGVERLSGGRGLIVDLGVHWAHQPPPEG